MFKNLHLTLANIVEEQFVLYVSLNLNSHILRIVLIFQVIRRHLLHAIRKKRPGAEVENFIFHQDNAPAHRAEDTLLTIDFLGFERLRHAPYSPDCAPMDYAVFPQLKSELRGRRFADLQQIRMAVRKVIAGYDKTWYSDIYYKWVERHRKCIAHNGEYFEKLRDNN